MKLPDDVLKKMCVPFCGPLTTITELDREDMQSAIDALCESGYAVVPKTPTRKMQEHGSVFLSDCNLERTKHIFLAMLAAYENESGAIAAAENSDE